MKFNRKSVKPSASKKGNKQPMGTEQPEGHIDTHMEDMLKGVDKKFSVFNRREERKKKKIQKKVKKSDFFSSSKDEKREKLRLEYIRAEEETLKKQIVNSKQEKKPELSAQEKQKQKDLAREKKAQALEAERIQREKQLEAERIKMDDEEIKYFENLLGKNKSKLSSKKYKKEISGDGWGDDFLSFLDNISATVKSDVKNYKPYFENEGVIDDAEINRLVEIANQPITITANNSKDKANTIKKLPSTEGDQSNSDQSGYEDEEDADDDDMEIEQGDEDAEDDFDDEGEDEDGFEEEQEDDEEGIDDQDESDDISVEGEGESDQDGDDISEESEENEDIQVEKEVIQKKQSNELPQLKSILKQTKSVEVNSINKQQQEAIGGKQKGELTEMEKWRLEKQQKKEAGMTEEEKERARILQDLEKKDFEKKLAIRKTLIQGFNRLSETNIDVIFREMLEAFEKNPKNLVNPIFSEIFTKTTIEPIKVAQHIMASNTIVVSAIHQIFDNECFAPVMKSLLLQYQEIIDNKGDLEAELAEESINEDSLFNRLRNITIVFSYFYIFDDVSIDFISGFLEHLLSHINVRTVEAILILVQHVGSKIRADNPSILKNVIDQTKKSVDAYTALLVANQKPIPKKLEFIMLTLNDIRLNKKQKTDPIQRLSFFTSWIKKNVLLKLKLTQKSFPIDFKYAYQSKKDTPRWYSTFETGAYRQGEQDEEDAQIQFGDRSELGHLNEATRKRLEALAIKCRMTTDTRKQIFMLVMSSEDYVDAAQRILKLKIVRKQLSEIAVVVIQCCAEEGKFNPYYVHLAAKLIEINPKIKFTFQYALWDQFKLIQDSQIRRISNLAKFLATMCSRKTLGITALKFFDLDQLSEQTVIFLKIFLSVFFDKISAEDLKVQVSKATARSENYVFVEGFKEFLKNYYWKFILSGKDKDNEQLKSAVKFTVKNLKMQLSKKELEGDD